MTQLCIPFRVYPSMIAIYAMVFTYAVIAVPFVVSGIVVCLALTGFPRAVSRLYAADLAGAALGCVLPDRRARLVRWSDRGALGRGAREPRRRSRSRAPRHRSRLRADRARDALRRWRSPPPGIPSSSGGVPVFRILYTKGSASIEPRPAVRQVELLLARARDRQSRSILARRTAGA